MNTMERKPWPGLKAMVEIEAVQKSMVSEAVDDGPWPKRLNLKAWLRRVDRPRVAGEVPPWTKR